MGKTEKVKKTKYEFNCDAKVALNTINEFLKANDYEKLNNSNGETYYKYKDGVVIGFLEYSIKDNLVTLYAYIRSEKKPMPLDDSFVGIIPKSHYKGIIEPLLKALSDSNSEGISSKQIKDSQQTQETNNSKDNLKNNNTYNEFAQKNKSSKEKFATLAFVMSLVGLFLSFLGITFGVIIIILEYYFAIQGLNSDKKGISIAAIVLASMSILINIFWIILSLAYN